MERSAGIEVSLRMGAFKPLQGGRKTGQRAREVRWRSSQSNCFPTMCMLLRQSTLPINDVSTVPTRTLPACTKAQLNGQQQTLRHCKVICNGHPLIP